MSGWLSGKCSADNGEVVDCIGIFLADGRTNRITGSLGTEATRLRDSGVQVYTVGIGNIAVNELRTIATDPDNEHVFILSSFLDAAGFVDFLSVTTCDSKTSRNSA